MSLILGKPIIDNTTTDPFALIGREQN
ncbi:unnamed protein product, partial [Rotaria sp. Silwood1]